MVSLLLAAGVALAVSLVGTRFLIDWLQAHRIGQPIHEDLPGHSIKAGTPTMGGLAIVVGAFLGYLASHLRSGSIFTRGGIAVILAIVGAGIVGLLDDWVKVKWERNLGLNKRTKFGGLMVVAIGFAILGVTWVDVDTELSFTRYDSIGWDLGNIGWSAFAVLLILATTNAVNLTDGLDGLAGGSAIFAFIAYTVIGFWSFRHQDIYSVPQGGLDLAVVSAAMLGGCTGFLWWNAAPARIIMGDCGALAIGAGLAGLALVSNTALLLPIVCGLYVMVTMSVIIQVGAFRMFGRRVFRIAPLHHHFEQLGWPETTVIIRFWILAGLCTALALGIYYADFISTGALD